MKDSQRFSLWVVIILVVCESLVFTPLCGALFACGCDWPWNGLDEHCNFYDQSATMRCPWCVSLLTGGLTFAFSVFSSGISLGYMLRSGVSLRWSMTLATGLFFLLTGLSAILSAAWQDYLAGWVAILRAGYD